MKGSDEERLRKGRETAARVTQCAKEALRRIVDRRDLPWPERYDREFWEAAVRLGHHDLTERRYERTTPSAEVLDGFLKDAESLLDQVKDTVEALVDDSRPHFDGMDQALSALKGAVTGDGAAALRELERHREALEEATKRAETKLAEQARTIEALSERLRVDPLTGLLNRRALEADLPKEIARARRYGYPLALLMADIDDFKYVNDTFGHQTGDKVLARLGELFTAVVRESDSVYRYGGEEFLCILPHTSCRDAQNLAERLRAESRRRIFVAHQSSEHLSVSLSIGLAELEEGDGPEELLKKADQALYFSKRGGKDRVETACPEVDGSLIDLLSEE